MFPLKGINHNQTTLKYCYMEFSNTCLNRIISFHVEECSTSKFQTSTIIIIRSDGE